MACVYVCVCIFFKAGYFKISGKNCKSRGWEQTLEDKGQEENGEGRTFSKASV